MSSPSPQSPSRPVVVLKVGTSSLVDAASGRVQVVALARVAETVTRLLARGYAVIIVSSGAVGLGCVRLGLRERPTTISGKQAAAAVGQQKLMGLYDDLFSVLGHTVAQVLLTYDTLGERVQYLNARATLHELLRLGVVPIVNENDTVAVAELRVGDNDSLSAHVAALVGASWLFLLTDVDSLYDANPRDVPSALPIQLVATSHIQNLRRQMHAGCPRLQPTLTLDAAMASAVGGSAWGTGGMATKIKAAQLATAAGCTVVVMNTARIELLEASLAHASAAVPPHAFADARVGTTFLPSPRPITGGRKRWVLSLAPSGTLLLDAGAAAAVAGAKSLFPAGVSGVEGDFEQHDAVSLVAAHDGTEVARALINYSADECRRLRGRSSKDVLEVLGYLGPEALADRDNIVLLAPHALE